MTIYTLLPKPTRLAIKMCSHCGLKYYCKSVKENIETYSGSGIRWIKHLKRHNATAIHMWNSDWFYDEYIVEVATKFSIENDIVESNEWANLAIENGIQGGYLGKDTHKRAGNTVSKTKQNKEWKETVGKNAVIKMMNTRTDPKWIETIGKETARKISISVTNTRNNKEWKETVGKEAKRKEKQTKENKEWQDSVWKTAKEKISNTKTSIEWKEKTGYEVAKKISKKRNDPIWKENNTVICTECNKKLDKANFGKWHKNGKCRNR